jgi:hypothetical protein
MYRMVTVFSSVRLVNIHKTSRFLNPQRFMCFGLGEFLHGANSVLSRAFVYLRRCTGYSSLLEYRHILMYSRETDGVCHPICLDAAASHITKPPRSPSI